MPAPTGIRKAASVLGALYTVPFCLRDEVALLADLGQ